MVTALKTLQPAESGGIASGRSAYERARRPVLWFAALGAVILTVNVALAIPETFWAVNAHEWPGDVTQVLFPKPMRPTG